MAESEYVQRDIAATRTRLEQIESTQRVLGGILIAQLGDNYSTSELIRLLGRSGASRGAVASMLGIPTSQAPRILKVRR